MATSSNYNTTNNSNIRNSISNSGGGGGGEEQQQTMAELSKTLKEGERIVAPTRRPDGTLRKPIRIRPGYIPQDEVAIYKSKGALWKKEMGSQDAPPGYSPVTDTKPKTKSVKRNERKKEKRQQAALEKNQNPEAIVDGDINIEQMNPEDTSSESADTLTSHMNELAISSNTVAATPLTDSTEPSDAGASFQDIDKKIRALKKKIRQAEAQLQKSPVQDNKPEQLEKLAKVEGWQQELKLLEGKKAEQASTS